MKIFNHEYTLIGNGTYPYKTYEIESEDDLIEFKRLFREARQLERIRLNKGSANKWIAAQVLLFGFYKSYPEMFGAIVSNNTEHPMQFYDIRLK